MNKKQENQKNQALGGRKTVEGQRRGDLFDRFVFVERDWGVLL